MRFLIPLFLALSLTSCSTSSKDLSLFERGTPVAEMTENQALAVGRFRVFIDGKDVTRDCKTRLDSGKESELTYTFDESGLFLLVLDRKTYAISEISCEARALHGFNLADRKISFDLTKAAKSYNYIGDLEFQFMTDESKSTSDKIRDLTQLTIADLAVSTLPEAKKLRPAMTKLKGYKVLAKEGARRRLRAKQTPQR